MLSPQAWLHLRHIPPPRPAAAAAGASSKPPSSASHRKTVSTWGVALLTFFSVSGGPWGSEEIISIAGPFPGFVCLFAITLVWAAPTCLITSELCSLLPHNGGYVLWVSMAFGEYWAFQDSFWSLLACIVDNALYPVLAYETIVSLTSGEYNHPLSPNELTNLHTWHFAYAGKFILTILFSIPVVFSKVEWMTSLMSVMLVCLSLPFCILLPYMLYIHSGSLSPSNLSAIREDKSRVDWVGLVHVTFWNLNGFDAASTCAGEVVDPRRSFLHGTFLGLGLSLVTTCIPLMVAVMVNIPHWQSWGEGYWSAIAQQAAGFRFALGVLLSSLMGTFGMHMSVMWEDSWQLCGMAEQGLVPKILARRDAYFGNPINSMLLLLLLVLVCIAFDFRFLVMVDNFFSVSSKILQILAYVRLSPSNSSLLCLPTVRTFRQAILNGRWATFLLPPLTLSCFILLSTVWDAGLGVTSTMLAVMALGLYIPWELPHRSKSIALANYTKL